MISKPLIRAEQNTACECVVSAEDVLKEEVAKLMTKLRESRALQSRLVNCRLPHMQTKKSKAVWTLGCLFAFMQLVPGAGLHGWILACFV